MSVVLDIAKRVMSPQTSPKRIQGSSYGSVYPNDRGKVGKSNARLYRNWAEQSEWVRTAINIRRSQVSAAEWDIVPFDMDKPFSEDLAQQLKGRLDQPNARIDSFRSFIEPIVEDILVLDAGCIEKVRSLRGEVVQLWGVDGAQIRVDVFWDGSEPDAPRYYWYPDWQERARLKNSDLIYIMANPRTYSPVGLSPLETLKLAVDAELAGNDFNRRQVTNAAPDGIFDLGEGARPEDVSKFKSYWDAEIAGKGALAFIGNTRGAKFIPFRGSNKDMQFLEWQQYLTRKIAAVFGLSPQDFGLVGDVNRSTAEVQQQSTEDRGLRPLMALIQDYVTREYCWDESFGGPDNNQAFRFTALNLKETKQKADINHVALAGIPWKTVNEARVEDGRAPLGDEFDKLMVIVPTGAVTLDAVPSAEEALESKKPAPPTASAPSGASRPRPKPSQD